MTLTKPTD